MAVIFRLWSSSSIKQFWQYSSRLNWNHFYFHGFFRKLNTFQNHTVYNYTVFKVYLEAWAGCKYSRKYSFRMFCDLRLRFYSKLHILYNLKGHLFPHPKKSEKDLWNSIVPLHFEIIPLWYSPLTYPRTMQMKDLFSIDIWPLEPNIWVSSLFTSFFESWLIAVCPSNFLKISFYKNT